MPATSEVINSTVRPPPSQSGDSQGQETFLAPCSDNQTHHYDTFYSRCTMHSYLYIHIFRIYK